MNITSWIVDFALLGAEWVMWALVVLSVLSISVMIERIMFYRGQRVDLDELSKDSIDAVQSNSSDAFKKKYADNSSMAVRVASAGVSHHASGIQSAEEAMQAAKTTARRAYDKRLIILGTLGSNAPFIGLFGTVLGIVSAFHRLQANPTGGIEVVMGEVSEALAATAVGIAVAIPAVVAFNLLGRKVRDTVTESDAIAHSILAEMHAQEESH